LNDCTPLKAPFPWFGGKSKVAPIVWSRLGNVPNYVEPFFGSGAVLLARPHPPKIETINDADGMVSNFWRAIQADPEAVAQHADWPVNERDLHARHYWLVTEGKRRLEGCAGDPLGYDAQAAGWWVWGLCSWITGGFCSGDGPWQWGGSAWVKRDAGEGIKRKLPHLGDAGRGINRQLPHLGRGMGINRIDDLVESFTALASRLRDVRVCCGDWSRVCGPTPTEHNGITGIFLDPPYADTAERDANIYAVDCLQVAHDVRRWAIENGRNQMLRICLAGYDGEHDMPEDWECVAWKTKGGYGARNEDNQNAAKERLWFSPHCLKPLREPSLFDLLEGAE